jgi:hypothetical protein
MVFAGIVTVGHADAFVSFGEIREEVPKHEGYRRFEEIAQILKAKYGDRIKDPVPTVRSKLYRTAMMGKATGSRIRYELAMARSPVLAWVLALRRR